MFNLFKIFLPFKIIIIDNKGNKNSYYNYIIPNTNDYIIINAFKLQIKKIFWNYEIKKVVLYVED